MIGIPSFSEILQVAHTRGQASDAPNLWDGLVGWWPLQEGGGTTAFDVSGYGNHGTLTNMDPATDWVMDEKGRCLDFDGSNDYINVATSDVVGSSAYTIVAWRKHGGAGGTYQTLFNLGASGNYKFNVHHHSDRPILYLGGSRYRYWDSSNPTALQDTAWHHIVLVVPDEDDASSWELYADAIPQNVNSTENTSTTGSRSKLQIGGNTDNGQYGDDQLADVRIYDRTLTYNEIAHLYADPWAAGRMRRRSFISESVAAPPAVTPIAMMNRQFNATAALQVAQVQS